MINYGDKPTLILLNMLHIPIVDQHFRTNRFCLLTPKSVHKRVYNIWSM